MTKNSKGQHVNSIVTTMASKCLSIRQINLLKTLLSKALTNHEVTLTKIEAGASIQARFLGKELRKAAAALPAKKAKEVVEKLAGMNALSTFPHSMAHALQDELLGKRAEKLRDKGVGQCYDIRGLSDQAREYMVEIHEECITNITFMTWSENVPAVMLNAFNESCTKAIKEAKKKIKAVVA